MQGQEMQGNEVTHRPKKKGYGPEYIMMEVD